MTYRSGISTADHDSYQQNGFYLAQSAFSEREVDVLRHAAVEELTLDTPRRTVEPATGLPYRTHGSHLHHRVFGKLVRDARLVLAASLLVGDDVYVHQFKINSKEPFSGGTWGWHQDFAFWHREDRMPQPRAVSAAVFLDDVTEFNGPIIVVPGAHTAGMLETPARSDGWAATTTQELKYNLADSPALPDLVSRNGLVAPKGPAGSVLWFHSNIPHASGQNMSPYGRLLILVSYNAVHNALPTTSPRPEWLIGRDFTPVAPVEGEFLDALA
jgi:ectoine hydroxylase